MRSVIAAARTRPLHCALLLAAAVPAQQFERDLEFVRSLAMEQRLFELARIEAGELARAWRDGASQDRIALLALEITWQQARTRSAPSEARTAFREALDQAKALAEGTDNTSVQQSTHRTLARIARDYGTFLLAQADLARDQAPDRVRDLEADAAAVLRQGVEASGAAMDALRDTKDERQRVEYFLAWLDHGVLQREQGRADRQNRGVLAARAIDGLTRLVLEVGEETTIGVRGTFEIALAKDLDGRVLDAVAGYQASIRQITASLDLARKGELGLSPEMQRFLFAMLQEVHAAAATTMLREGDPGLAAALAAFRTMLAAHGEPDRDVFDVATQDHGHRVFLVEAQLLAESGEATQVLAGLHLAQRLSERHPYDAVGANTRTLLARILADHPELATGELLLGLARGAAETRDHDRVVATARAATAAMTAAERTRFGLDAGRLLAGAFLATERPLEAALALADGLRAGAAADEATHAAADELERALAAHRRQTRDDPAFAELQRELTALAAAHADVAAGQRTQLRRGIQLFNERQYEAAIEHFRRVTREFPAYDLACTNIARAQVQLGDLAAARETVAAFRAQTAATPLPTGDPRQGSRQRALADAEFLDVQLAYLQARGAEGGKSGQDLTRYPAAIELAKAFVANATPLHQRDLPAVLEFLGRLHCDLAQMPAAEQAWASLKPLDPARASRLASELFREYQNQVRLLTRELDQAVADDSGPAAIRKATLDLGVQRARLADVGLQYAATSPKPQLAILVATIQALEAQPDWARIGDLCQKALDVHGGSDDAAAQRTLDHFVRPKLGEALLQQRRCTEALVALQATERATPSSPEVRRLICRALGGWFEFDAAGKPVWCPGLERPDEAYTKGLDADTLPASPLRERWSLAWYTWQFELFGYARAAAQKDGKWQAAADAVFRVARATDDFGALKQLGQPGLRLHAAFEALR
ncbi:MAG: tetratricopeptide repeat protein [Planctomycetes bacterium]|nr:tetratricopeptide repeat protein [Planctomycetota bacterium]